MFDKAFDRTVGIEKGYVNNPADPGGETNWGISKRAYPNLDIKNLTKDGAKAIYKMDYWDKVGGDTLPPALAYQVFDFAVNSGVPTALRLLKEIPDHDPLKFLATRLDFISRLGIWPKFGRGLSRRVAINMRYLAEDLNEKD